MMRPPIPSFHGITELRWREKGESPGRVLLRVDLRRREAAVERCIFILRHILNIGRMVTLERRPPCLYLSSALIPSFLSV